jgi:polynucleotide 5'-hydroxyl-kinase GRC3/NOL9
METPTSSADLPFLAQLEVLPEWQEAARRFLEADGAVLVLGAPDTGKSSLSRYLVYRAYAAGQKVGLVDLDLGQSHLGPPAALGLGLFPPLTPGDDALSPQSLHFVGQTSPPGAIMEVAVGCRILADEAASQGIERLVVNTSGFFQGPGALRLKKAQAELLRPGLILALQQNRELEPLLWGLAGTSSSATTDRGWPILRLPVSSRVNRRDPEMRRLYREERFRGYFQKAQELLIPWGSFTWEGVPLGQGRPLPPWRLRQFDQHLGIRVLYGESQGRRAVLLTEQPPPPAAAPEQAGWPDWDHVHWLSWESLQLRLVGLLDGRHRTLALGLILPDPWNRENLALLTPLPPAAAASVDFVKLGKVRLNLEGQELPHV